MRPPFFVSLFLSWLAAEFLALWLVVEILGWWDAIFLSLATSLLGVVVLRRLGAGAARSLRQAIEGAPLTNGRMFDGLLTALGGLLLLLPGFVSDLAGLALAAPSLRQWIARRLGAKRVNPSRAGAVVDLSPDDWRAEGAGARAHPPLAR